MTVEELRWKLREYDSDTEVVIWDHRRGEWIAPEIKIQKLRDKDGEAVITLC